MLDELAANAAAAPMTRLVDGWLAKAAPLLPFRRANAVLPPPSAGDDARSATHALDALDAWYRSLGRRLLVQVPSSDPVLDELLAARGLAIEAPCDVLVADIDVVAEAGSRSLDRLRVAAEEREASSDPLALRVDVGVDAPWSRRHGRVGDDPWRLRLEGYGRMLSVLGTDALAATATSPVGADAHLELIGTGIAVLDRGWAGVFGMATTTAWRRCGVGGALLGALATAAEERGARHLYLQVECDNAPAQRLYRGLGFNRSHGYHYRVSEARSAG
jgi:ribosomal protein S18 acetylase RimI-like enzyme